VTKSEFYHLLHNYTSLTAEEAESLILLNKQYPYSQVLYSLAARAAHDLSFDQKDSLLQLSAIYTADRGVLKSIMSAPSRAREVVTLAETDTLPNHQESKIVLVIETQKPETDALPPDLASVSANVDIPLEDVLNDISRMHESMHRYEEVVYQLEHGIATDIKPEVNVKPTTKSEKPTGTDKLIPTEQGTEGIIDEIKATKKKIKPEGTHQKEQQEIIDQFIKTQPTITRPKPEHLSEQAPDLMASLTEFNDSIVSETLVEILLKQGKKEKAIEVLKKLIWKYPQKKAYFAAQIEDLKK
jgi:hypothetical protein